MSRSRFARLSLVLVLFAAFTTPSAWGAPFLLPGATSSFDILARVWNSLVVLWAKEGCNIDPHGLCVYTPTPTQEAGCILDHHGACIEVQGDSPVLQPTTEARCGLDPHGVCIP